MIAIYFSKQQALDADPKGLQKVNFTRNVRGTINRVMLFITE